MNGCMHRSVRDAIEHIVKTENIPRTTFHEAEKLQWENVIKAVAHTFIRGTPGQEVGNLHWAWLHFREAATTMIFRNDDAFRYIDRLVDDDSLWFIAEDRREKYWVYEGDVSTVGTVLGKTWFFDYYLVSKKYDWLLCEDHHGVLYGIGEKVVRKMEEFKISSPEFLL